MPHSTQSVASGIDTVGDIRVPAACCGVLGFRASHGTICMAGVIPVASSCDAVGELLWGLFDVLTSPFFDSWNYETFVDPGFCEERHSYAEFCCKEVAHLAGWFARDAGMLLLVGRQLCTPHSEADDNGPKRFHVAQDVFKLSSVPHSVDILSRSVQRTVGRKLPSIA